MAKYDGALFILVDALGWEIYQRVGFLEDCSFPAKKTRSILGYSSTCYPSIFSGQNPEVHGLWNSYFYSTDPVSPHWIKHFRHLPKKIRNSWKVRNLVSRYLKSRINSDGYFSLYRVPFEYLCYFGYAEETDLLKPHGLKTCETIFDTVDKLKLRSCIPHYAASDQKKLEEIYLAMQNEKDTPQFIFTALGSLDTFMHAHGPDGQVVDDFIKNLDAQVKKVIDQAHKTYKNPYIGIFSDHGMARITQTADIWPQIDSLGLVFGSDYVAFYNATMARFWFLNEKARKTITQKLDCEELKKFGHRLTQAELKAEGCFFSDGKYGEEIFLTNAGIEIIPSFMSDRKLSGMHGYHPNDKDSWGYLACSEAIPNEVKSIKDIYGLMTTAANSIL